MSVMEAIAAGSRAAVNAVAGMFESPAPAPKKIVPPKPFKVVHGTCPSCQVGDDSVSCWSCGRMYPYAFEYLLSVVFGHPAERPEWRRLTPIGLPRQCGWNGTCSCQTVAA